MIDDEPIDFTFGFPERLWKRPIELHDGKLRPRVAASSYNQGAPYRMFDDEAPHVDLEDRDGVNQTNKDLAEPRVKVSTEEGNAKVTVELASVDKKDLNLHCAEDSLTLSVSTPAGSWVKEIPLPFRVDPDTARAAFRNGKLELIVRKHSTFNPPRPRVDWV